MISLGFAVLGAVEALQQQVQLPAFACGEGAEELLACGGGVSFQDPCQGGAR